MVVKQIVDKPDTRGLEAGPSNKLHTRAIVNWGQSGCMKDADARLEPQCRQATRRSLRETRCDGCLHRYSTGLKRHPALPREQRTTLVPLSCPVPV